MRFLVLTLVGTALLWSLWVFGFKASLTEEMSLGFGGVLDVLVGVGIAVLALLGATTAVIRQFKRGMKGLDAEVERADPRYRTIVEKTNDIILEISPEGVIVFVNPAVTLLGYDLDDLVGRSIEYLIPEGDRAKAIPNITTRRVGPRATFNFPLSILTNPNAVLSDEIPKLDFLVDASGLWRESDDVVMTQGTAKTFLGTLFIAHSVNS